MPEKTSKPPQNRRQVTDENREKKILNLLSNTSLLLMILVTEAFSEVFTSLSRDFVSSLSSSLNIAHGDKPDLDVLQQQFPDSLRKELLAMKQDLEKQIQEKRQKLGPLLADQRFDKGITIAEHSMLHLPSLTHDLDEAALLSYVTLLQANDQKCTAMFQQLLEWMNNLPQLHK